MPPHPAGGLAGALANLNLCIQNYSNVLKGIPFYSHVPPPPAGGPRERSRIRTYVVKCIHMYSTVFSSTDFCLHTRRAMYVELYMLSYMLSCLCGALHAELRIVRYMLVYVELYMLSYTLSYMLSYMLRYIHIYVLIYIC